MANAVDFTMSEHLIAVEGFSKKLDLNILKQYNSETLFLNITSDTTDHYDIFFANLDASPYYTINTDIMIGDHLMTDKPNTRYVYTISLEEVHWLEESGECMEYGSQVKHKSYADCVAGQQTKMFEPLLGCKIPWQVAPNEPGTCDGDIELSGEKCRSYISLFPTLISTINFNDKTEQTEACLKPCFESVVKIKRKYMEGIEGHQQFILNFRKKVNVIKHMKAYDLFDLVVEIGSCLGLWIGFSAISFFDFIIEYAVKIKKISQ